MPLKELTYFASARPSVSSPLNTTRRLIEKLTVALTSRAPTTLTASDGVGPRPLVSALSSSTSM